MYVLAIAFKFDYETYLAHPPGGISVGIYKGFRELVIYTRHMYSPYISDDLHVK